MKITSFLPQALMPTISLLVLFLITCETHAMASLAKHYVLFSNISGTITIDGKPLSNAKVVRTVRKAHTTDTELTDETTTDVNGYFSMPAIRQKSVAATFLPMAFGTPQLLHVYHKGTKQEIWSGTKMDPAENAEANGKPLVVECDLTNERKRFRVSGSSIYTKCRWNIVEDVEEPFLSPEREKELRELNEQLNQEGLSDD